MGNFLIAEDDAALGRSIARLLAKLGKTRTVDSVVAALENLEREAYDGIIVDISLSDGSGFEILRFARARRLHVMSLVLSGTISSERLTEAHQLGASYLLKPASIESIRIFGERALRGDDATAVAIQAWQRDYRLTPSETEVLRLAAFGHERSSLADLRDVEPCTIKKQVVSMLSKTLDSSLENAVSRLLRQALERRGDTSLET